MSQNHKILQLKKITKIFSRGTIDEVAALDSIDLDVNPSDYITIIGSNGAGKTTLLNVIGGNFPPERGGKVIIGGKDVTNLSECKHAAYIGRVFQDLNVGTAAEMTIEENMVMAVLRGYRRGLRAARNKQRRELFRSALAPLGLGLEKRLDAYVGTLSSGQRQAVALTMATINNPSLLLLDEHIANLDPKTAHIVLELTEMIVQREKITTMMITHNMELALRYGNRLIMMHEGRIVVDMNQEQRAGLTINDLVGAFEQASGRKFIEDKILLRR